MIHSHINCTLFLHRCRVHTFLSVSLNCLHEMMQSNTGCICLTFLHCVFSASSNRLHPPLCVFKRVLKEGANHIGYICLTFLHCALSNVSSNRLHKKMHIHIGCICLAFLHCAFSNVPSNCLRGETQNCIGCICLIFLYHYLCFSREHLHWPHWSDHLQDFDPSPQIMDCCLLCTVSFKLRKWGLRKREQMKVRVIITISWKKLEFFGKVLKKLKVLKYVGKTWKLEEEKR